MSAFELSTENLDALRDAVEVVLDDYDAGRGWAQGGIESVVEVITQAAINAALNDAADAIKGRFDAATEIEPHDPLCLDGDVSTTEAERNGWLSGLKNASFIVRARVTH